MIDKRFSAAAQTYDRHARPQWTLAQTLISMLPECDPEQILELGAGTGQLTSLVAERFQEAKIDAVDLAEQMVRHSRDKFHHYPHIHWIVGDARTYRGETPYPLIVSSAALHWVEDLDAACRNIHANLQPGGIFALGMMLDGTLGELHALRAAIAPAKTPPIGLPSYDRTAECLQAAGFHLDRRKHSTEEIWYTDAPAFLRAIHEQGVTGGRISAGSAPLTRTELLRLTEAYQETHGGEDGVRATYETGLFILSKPHKTGV